MKTFKEIIIPVCLWVFFIISGINGGRGIAMESIQPPDPIPLGLQVAIYSVAFLAGLVITVLNMKRRKMGFESVLETVFSPESFYVMVKRIRPFLLGATFFGLIGIAGTIQARMHQSPIINQQILGVPFMAGFGILIGWMIGKKGSK